MTTVDHTGIRKVSEALVAAGMPEAAAGILVLDEDVRTAAGAAEAVGVAVGAIANSLVFKAEIDGAEQPLLALTSGAHRADLARLATLVDATRVRKADPEFVRAHTGQVIGGVGPVGHPRPVRTLVDQALAQYPQVWAAAGHPKAVFPTTYDELLRLTGGTPAKVAEVGEDRQV